MLKSHETLLRDRYGFQSSALLTAFRGAWEWLIMPLLTTHMTLTFLSAGLERLPTGEEA